MAPIKVQVLYDFTGEPGTGELSISQGEILTVTRQDVGEGWWEGKNSSGQTGLFPAAYVVNYDTADYWGDEEWDDEESASSTIDSHPPPSYQPPELPSATSMPPTVPPPSSQPLSTSSSNSKVGASAPLKAKYSNFPKTAGEHFITSVTHIKVADEEKVKIIDTDNIIDWSPAFDPYFCTVASPKKESKLKGLKSYVTYQLTPSFNNIQVSRRYKHFDWLHERLEEKYCYIPIPPLPEKQISNRYEEQFIEHRKHQLQAFVDYVCRHPVLSRSEVWLHFITCTDERQWKTGKRKAEKEELVGGNFFHCVEAPVAQINPFALEQDTATCSKFIHTMETSVKHMMDVTVDQTKKYQIHLKRDFQKIGQVFYTFGQGLSVDVPPVFYNINLTEAIKKMGDAYNDVGKMFEEQPKADWEPLFDMLHLYKGILTSMPLILSFHKKALNSKRENEKLAFDQKMTTEELDLVTRRTDIISYSVLAEINHFHRDSAQEINKTMKSFISEQIKFYQNIVDKLQQAYNAFDN